MGKLLPAKLNLFNTSNLTTITLLRVKKEGHHKTFNNRNYSIQKILGYVALVGKHLSVKPALRHTGKAKLQKMFICVIYMENCSGRSFPLQSTAHFTQEKDLMCVVNVVKCTSENPTQIYIKCTTQQSLKETYVKNSLVAVLTSCTMGFKQKQDHIY